MPVCLLCNRKRFNGTYTSCRAHHGSGIHASIPCTYDCHFCKGKQTTGLLRMDISSVAQWPYRTASHIVTESIDMKSAEGAKYRTIAMHGALWVTSVFLLWRYSEKLAV